MDLGPSLVARDRAPSDSRGAEMSNRFGLKNFLSEYGWESGQMQADEHCRATLLVFNFIVVFCSPVHTMYRPLQQYLRALMEQQFLSSKTDQGSIENHPKNKIWYILSNVAWLPLLSRNELRSPTPFWNKFAVSRKTYFLVKNWSAHAQKRHQKLTKCALTGAWLS